MAGWLIFLGVVVPLVVIFVYLIRQGVRLRAEGLAKQEAFFVSMFPDLQPYYHPKNVLEFVRARLAQEPARGGMRMAKPPGFDVPAAEVLFQDDKGKRREIWRLLDAAGVELSRFMFEADAKDGMVRVGKGKFRVSRTAVDRVRYWHPDREFKWTPALWKFVTRVFEQPVQSSDSGLSFGDSSSSSSSTARTAAAAAGIAAAGGAFDGGGASGNWSEAGGDGASASSEAAGATSY